MDGLEAIVTVAVAVIGAGAVVVGPLLHEMHKQRRELQQFRDENSTQHGQTLGVIREIELTTRETRNDVRELRADFEDHKVNEHQTAKEPNVTVPKRPRRTSK